MDLFLYDRGFHHEKVKLMEFLLMNLRSYSSNMFNEFVQFQI